MRKKHLFPCIIFLVLLLCACGCEQKKPKGFALSRILAHRTYDPAWETRPLTVEEEEEVNQALGKTYRFFNRGGQCSVFFSDDGKYALKFLTKRLYTPPAWLEGFPLPKSYKEKKRGKKADKLKRDFTSYKIAFEEFQEETGLLYLHLNPSQHLPSLTLVDHKGVAQSIDLNAYDFILQKRAQLILPALSTMQKAEAKIALDRLMHLIATFSTQGVYDRDPSLFTNYGFLGPHPVKVDIGSFVRQESVKERGFEELLRTLAPLCTWLQGHDPELDAYVKKRVDEMAESEGE